MATGELHTKLPWAAMKRVRDEILPPDIWPDGAPFGELSRLKRSHLDEIFDNIILMEHPTDNSDPTPFRFQKCIRRGSDELVDPLYEGMPKADGSSDGGEDGDGDGDIAPETRAASPAHRKKKGKTTAASLRRVPDSTSESESEDDMPGLLDGDDEIESEDGVEDEEEDEDEDEDEVEEGLGGIEVFLPAAEVSARRIASPEEANLEEPSEMVQGAPPQLSQRICIQSMVSDFCPAISAHMAGIATEMFPEEPAAAAADSISSAVPVQRKAPRPRAAAPPSELSFPAQFLPDMRRHFLRGLSKDQRYHRFLAAFNEKVCHTHPSAPPILLMPRYSDGHVRRHTADRAAGMGYMAVVSASPS